MTLKSREHAGRLDALAPVCGSRIRTLLGGALFPARASQRPGLFEPLS